MKVELLKSVKYKGQSYKAGTSIDADANDIAEMIAKKVVSEDTEIPEGNEDQGSSGVREPKETDIEKMKVAELKEYAEENGIDLGDATKKDEILEVIKEAEAVANADTTS
ncbi:Rho termination factor N-terminal domain-containing protein [Paenibacillus illinoisensis]|uniref:Rho termination factor N-terminal domain-containing protein n=1 Tax=Paenibacillus illinoisensis TaxID=59845 RepID=A0ABW8HYI7_9BACL